MSLKLTFIFIFLSFTLFSQTTVSFQPDANDGKDAYVISSSTSNFGSSSYIYAYVNANSTTTYIRRSYIEFDLTSIPSNAIILSSELKLYRQGGDNAPTMEINRVIDSWSESTIAWGSTPDITNSDMLTLTPSDSSGWHVYDVSSHVQKMVNYSLLNYGWRIKSEDETLTSYSCLDRYGNPSTCYYPEGTFYRSSDYSGSTYDPTLKIIYVLPIEITLNQITHADTPASSNGSISVNVDEGNGTYTYQWIDGATGNDLSGETASSISGLSPGWYGVKVTDGLGNISYMAFVVGAKCGVVQIDFQPDGRFVDDAYIAEGYPAYFGTDYPNTNYGSSPTLQSENIYDSGGLGTVDYTREFLFKNLLIIPNNIDLVSVDQTFFGYNHLYANGNKSKLLTNTQDWQENVVTWNIKPSHNSFVNDLLSTTTSSTENKVLDHTNLYSNYQSGSSNNYGYTVELNYNPLGTIDREMSFYSSDYSNASLRPKLVLRLGDICSYAKPQKKLDSETYKPVNGVFYFEFNDEYVDGDGELNYMVYDEDRKDAFNGSSPVLDVNIGDNRCSFDVSGLSAGIYILELTNDKKEKFLIRFKI